MVFTPQEIGDFPYPSIDWNDTYCALLFLKKYYSVFDAAF